MSQQIENAISYFRYIIFDKLKNIDCWVAGGAVRDFFSVGKPLCDVDVFFPSTNEYNGADEILSKDNKVVSDTENGKMIIVEKRKFHLIKKHFYDSPESTIRSFDFTVCCAAVDREKIYNHYTFFIDLARRRIVINNLPFPLSSLQRLQKYIKKGFWICNGGLLDLSKAIAKIDFENKDSNVFEYYPDGSPKFKRIG